LGAAGGLVVEIIAVWANLTAWQRDRHRARANGRKRVLPTLTKYIDPPADALVGLTRLLMGAAAGWLLHDQITGIMAAIAVGAAAPALLRQLGTARTVQDALQASEASQAPVAAHTVSLASGPPAAPPPRKEYQQTEGAIE
jgi:hypothetical protein